MDFTAKRLDLVAALSHAASVAKQKSPMPILSCALLTAAGGRLTVRATDMNVEVCLDVTAAIAEAGARAVKAADLLERVKLMPEGPVRLTLKNERLSVRASGSLQRHEVKTIDGADYPASTTIAGVDFTIDSKVLVGLIRRVAYAASEEQGARSLLLLHSDGVRLSAYAGDSIWLAKADVALSAPHAVMALPLVCAEAIARAFANTDDKLNVVVSENAISLASGRLRFASTLSSMTPPPFAQVIEQSIGTSRFSVTVMRKRMLELVKSAGMADTTIDLEIHGNELRARSESSEGGESSDQMDIENEDGGSCKLRLITEQTLTILGKIPDEMVTIGVGDARSPVVYRGDRFVYINSVVMQ